MANTFTEDEFSVFDFASGISEAVDLVSADLNDHHKRVAYISYSMAKEMNLPDEEIRDIVLAAILHDIGAFTHKERLKITSALFDDNHDNACDGHQTVGYKLLRDFEPFSNAAYLIKYHHAHFAETKENVPTGSHVIHLADRIAVLIDKNRELLAQIPAILGAVDERKAMFHPEALDAFSRLAKMEFFWIEACLLPVNQVLPERIRFSKKIIDLDTLKGLAKVMSQIIDFRSSFTSTHSSGVAAVARELSDISGFSERECRLMEMAGYLHDIGKLAISNDILEKQGSLDKNEFNEMRKHPYYTYAILNKIKGFEQVAMWASCHHERLDGQGYPFHVRGESFSRLARIMAVADIVVAITEDRPYRSGMGGEKAIEILYDMAGNGGIDKSIVEVVKENFPHINEMRIRAQERAWREYKAFYSV